MPFTFRKRLRLGPLYAWFNGRRITSWGITLGPLTRNVTRGTTSVDLPGDVNWRSRPTLSTRRTRSTSARASQRRGGAR